jgi:hypothetical protein
MAQENSDIKSHTLYRPDFKQSNKRRQTRRRIQRGLGSQLRPRARANRTPALRSRPPHLADAIAVRAHREHDEDVPDAVEACGRGVSIGLCSFL